MINRIIAFWNAYKLVRHYQRLHEAVDWTDGDRITLYGFLNSPAGVKMLMALESHIVSAGQTVIANNGGPFDMGVVHGMKIIWTYIRSLTQAGSSPQDEHE